jgi:hypothetical protein
VVLIFISISLNNVEHFFMYLLDIDTNIDIDLRTVHSIHLPICQLVLNILSYLYILHFNSMSYVQLVNILYHSVDFSLC